MRINSDGELPPEHFEVATDYFFYGFAFCKERGFNTEKTSVFLSIMKAVLDADCASSGPSRTMKTSFVAFKELVLSHAVERPPHSSGIFEVDDVARIIEYMLNSYFRHYNLYRYIFTKKMQVTLVQSSPHSLEVPKTVPPLSEALPQMLG